MNEAPNAKGIIENVSINLAQDHRLQQEKKEEEKEKEETLDKSDIHIYTHIHTVTGRSSKRRGQENCPKNGQKLAVLVEDRVQV